MPPKAISFKANSIVYFKGDKGESVYILQKGQVSLNYLDIQTGQEMHDYVQTGEFFGVKAAFGKYPHDETAVVMVNSTVIQFTVDDFEQLLSSNSRIIMKMLKVFSNQLRRIHKQVRSLMSVDEQVDAEKGLYSVGEYYFNNKKHLQAADAFNRYLIYYPAGRYVDEVRRKIEYAESRKDSIESGPSAPVAAPRVEYTMEKALALRDKGNYVEALKAFIILSKSNPDQKILTDFEAGICVFRLKKGNETIKHFTDILKRNPAHSRMGEALYYIGKSYLMLDDKEKAKSFLNKSSSLLDEGCPEQRDAVLLLEQLGGS
ncbi:cyclic nucleotide-binding domain-containing protein [Oceanispirochaeta sp.]|jgi:TolA-binding protein|uniref:cyclic nucleotide-binding domain-containing protein n=1 Tax=Oceanispirochaeta sp. TaxID=2035350 RepID=UPI0026301E06|nr:cyclic nucleotide-binding domain-containing protein [Oceanispirochaeta sp.]MDA3956527.1 cyclic nucleotide-binding domain-containing protein [Oceanispirochaeta sp.]